MKRLIMLFALFCLAAGTARADVSNEVIVGLETDSTSEAIDSTGADVTDSIDNTNSLFVAQYTHFFSPLREDDKPIELRRFYQHPSTLSAGLAFIGATTKDSTIPSDEETSGAMLLLGGELYLPTHTGFFLNIGAGSGTIKDNTGGPDTDLEMAQFGLGVRQYLGGSAAVHLRLQSESNESKLSGFDPVTSDKAVLYLGGRGVIADVVGLALELGTGKREQETSGTTTKFEIAAVNAEVAGYIGKHLTVSLALEAESEDLEGLPAGIAHTLTTSRMTLAARYWFSERFGLELPLYSEKEEIKTEYPGGEFTESTTQTGIGLYAGFRF